eukprot:1684366-Amphidinium_carterae.1
MVRRKPVTLRGQSVLRHATQSLNGKHGIYRIMKCLSTVRHGQNKATASHAEVSNTLAFCNVRSPPPKSTFHKPQLSNCILYMREMDDVKA